MENIKKVLQDTYPEATENDLHLMKTSLIEFVATCIQIINNKEKEDTKIPENGLKIQ